jgi:hypothetical protein
MGWITDVSGQVLRDSQGFPLVDSGGYPLVMAVVQGCYDGSYHQQGDIFILWDPNDFSDASVNYSGHGSGVQQFGWMQYVADGTQEYDVQAVQVPAPLFPVLNTTPPVIYVY